MRRTPVIRRYWVFVIVIVTLAVPASAMSKKEQAALDAANQEWRGATCLSRIGIVVKKPKKKDWTKCEPIFHSPKGGNDRVKVHVSDGAAVHRAFYGGAIPPGTEFRVLGWSAEKGGDSLCLEFELVDHPVQLRAFFGQDWGQAGVKKLDSFERWVRFEFLDVVLAPAEQLVEAPVAAVSRTAPTAGSPALPDASTSVAVTGPPTVAIDAVAVQPARVAAGSNADLVITYTASGVPAGTAFDVVERREIYFGEQRIAGFEEQIRRANGTHPSRQTLTVPIGTAPGVYTLRATVIMAGREESSTAIFEVQAP